MKRLILFLSFLISYLLLFIHATSAHPMPIAVQEVTLNYSKDSVNLIYKLRMEPLATARVYGEIDKTANGAISDDEINDYSKEVLKSLTGRMNNKDFIFEKTGDKRLLSSQILSFENSIEIDYKARDPKILETNTVLLSFNKKIVPEDPYGDMIVFMDNTENNPNISKISENQTNTVEKNEYSSDFKLLNYSGNQTSNNKNSKTTGNKKNSISSFFDNTSKASKKLSSEIFSNKRTGVLFFVIGILIAFFAGALHAVTPGHGKSMMAAFLVGKKESKAIDVLILGLSITISHTLVIFILGFTLLAINKTDTINRIIPYFEKASAVLLILLGINLINNAYKNYKHNSFHKDHGEDPNHYHDHGHSHFNEKIKIKSRKDLFVAGLSGGIVPCVDALSLLILSVGLGKIAVGLVFILFFSIGLATAITSLGLILVYSKSKLNVESRFGNLAEIYAPLISGIIIVLLSLRFIL